MEVSNSSCNNTGDGKYGTVFLIGCRWVHLTQTTRFVSDYNNKLRYFVRRVDRSPPHLEAQRDRKWPKSGHDLSKLGSGVSHHHRYRLLASVANLLQKHGILLLGLFSPFPISQLCHRTRLLKRWTFAGKENSNRVAVWPYRGCDSMSRGSKCLEPDIL